MRLQTYLVMSIFAVFIACSPGRLVINHDYRSGIINGETLAVVILDPRPLIAYDGNVEPEFGRGNQDSLIYSFFKSQLLKDIRRLTNFKYVRFDKCSADCRYDNQIINSRPSIVEIQVPADGAVFHCGCGEPDFVLFIDYLSIGTSSRVDVNPVGMMASGMVIGSYFAEKKLFFASKVILWDNTARKNVLYGFAEASATVLYIPVITMTQWLEVSDSFVRKIFSRTALMKSGE